MNLWSALRWIVVAGLSSLLACSTPISFEPQIDEDESTPDAAGTDTPRDAGGARDAGADAALPRRDGGFDCEVYRQADAGCPPNAPALNTKCMPIPDNGTCYYESRTPGELVLAQCVQQTATGVWSLSVAPCSYRCSTELPQGGNFFSLFTDGCATRRLADCRNGSARTSQEGVDNLLSERARACGLSAAVAVGISFDAQGCPDWFHYQTGPRLTNAQQQCLEERLEVLRIGCDARCAVAPAITP